MQRVRVAWNGSPLVGPGLTTFYLADTATSVAGILTFFGAIANKFPPGITWTVPNDVDQIASATGALTGGATLTGGGTQVSTGTGTRFAMGVGARIRWGTNSVVGGRRLFGGTFLVPLMDYCYGSDGTLDATNLSQMQTAVNNLIAASSIGVWHRPHEGAADGAYASISSGTIADKVSTLRSRRT